eukprot:CAMPEP_0180615014 /NCGR_PEP_ID=MMETSP1037_2-20121125/31723_1 /TAXON_ID=632150 /ORGANISM="Azadinium spinosum, Strain 3D9" /LENGTH=165 /DNA_ID=CAMNT_0022634763 /DNA_START=206 /DNA_END=702 /DNA_ORIENTATION=-
MRAGGGSNGADSSLKKAVDALPDASSPQAAAAHTPGCLRNGRSPRGGAAPGGGRDRAQGQADRFVEVPGDSGYTFPHLRAIALQELNLQGLRLRVEPRPPVVLWHLLAKLRNRTPCEEQPLLLCVEVHTHGAAARGTDGAATSRHAGRQRAIPTTGAIAHTALTR